MVEPEHVKVSAIDANDVLQRHRRHRGALHRDDVISAMQEYAAQVARAHRLTAAKSDTGWEPPAGWMLVPVEPTEAMMFAGFRVNKFVNLNPCGPSCVGRVTIPPRDAWSAMIAAAPTPEVDRG